MTVSSTCGSFSDIGGSLAAKRLGWAAARESSSADFVAGAAHCGLEVQIAWQAQQSVLSEARSQMLHSHFHSLTLTHATHSHSHPLTSTLTLTCTLTHTHTHTPTHSPTHSLTRPPTHTHSLPPSLPHSLVFRLGGSLAAHRTAPHRNAPHRNAPQRHATARHATARHATARHGTARHSLTHSPLPSCTTISTFIITTSLSGPSLTRLCAATPLDLTHTVSGLLPERGLYWPFGDALFGPGRGLYRPPPLLQMQ